MEVSLKGFDEKCATFKTSGEVKKGSFVKIKESLTVEPCVGDDDFIGICENVNGNYANIKLRGYVESKYSGTAPTLGYAPLVPDASGGLKISEREAQNRLAVYLDESSQTVGIIL